jgi:hypothetical protein
MPVELLDDKELLAVVEDGYLLSGIGKDKGRVSPQDVRRLYEVEDAVKVWIDWVMRTRKFVEEC